MSSGDRLAGSMEGWVECDVVLPATPDDAEPGSGEDAHGVVVPAAPHEGAAVDVGGPWVDSAEGGLERHVTAEDRAGGEQRLTVLMSRATNERRGCNRAIRCRARYGGRRIRVGSRPRCDLITPSALVGVLEPLSSDDPGLPRSLQADSTARRVPTTPPSAC
jgi:hypothetical protein